MRDLRGPMEIIQSLQKQLAEAKVLIKTQADRIESDEAAYSSLRMQLAESRHVIENCERRYEERLTALRTQLAEAQAELTALSELERIARANFGYRTKDDFFEAALLALDSVRKNQ